MKAFTVVAVAALLSQATPPGGGPWPPNGIYPASAVDTPPAVAKRVDPNYTPAAVRARIEGIVHLLCVVNADGTVGETRVAKSLDAENGLDAAAVAAVKQWEFSPAIKNGHPVPTAVAVDVAFTLGGAPRSFTWPDGFAPPGPPPLATAAWRSETFEDAGLRIELSAPPGWTVRRNPDDRSLATLRKDGTLSTLGVLRPMKTGQSFDRPLTPVELEQAAANVERSLGGQAFGVQSIGFGQAQAGDHLWAWHAYRTETAVPPTVDPQMAPIAEKVFESIRAWTFDATIGGQTVHVMCFAAVPRSGSADEKARWVADQAAAFAEILRRMKISVVP